MEPTRGLEPRTDYEEGDSHPTQLSEPVPADLTAGILGIVGREPKRRFDDRADDGPSTVDSRLDFRGAAPTPIRGERASTGSDACAVTHRGPDPTLIQPLLACAGCCSTTSPSIRIWISSLTTNLPSSITLKLRPNCLRLIWLLAL